MITAEDLKALQIDRPFRPFSVRLIDGRTIEFLRPGAFLVTRERLHIGVPAEAEIPDRTERIALLHIASIEGRRL